MKKIISLMVFCGITVSLACADEKKVDIYRRIIPYDSNMATMPLLGGFSIFFLGWGYNTWYKYYFTKYHGLDLTPGEERNGKDAPKSMLVGGLCASVSAWYIYKIFKKVFRNYQLRNVSILSLRSSGLWYKQKFICKWEDIHKIEEYTCIYGTVANKSLRLYGLTSENRDFYHFYQFVSIDLLALKCSKEELIDMINEFCSQAQ